MSRNWKTAGSHKKQVYNLDKKTASKLSTHKTLYGMHKFFFVPTLQID